MTLPSLPSPPSFTPSSLIDLFTKVYIITIPSPTSSSLPSSSSFLQLASILYSFHATIYLALPSLSHYTTLHTQLHSSCPESKGSIHPFIIKPSSLDSVKAAVEGFLEREWRLDVLFLCSLQAYPQEPRGLHEASSSMKRSPNPDLLTSFLLARLLTPILHTTTSHSCHPNPNIRVVWISAEAPRQKQSASSLSPSQHRKDIHLLARAFAQLSVSTPSPHTGLITNPHGVQHIVADLHLPPIVSLLLPVFRGAEKRDEYAACTLLYAGLGLDVRSGDAVVPWGRKVRLSKAYGGRAGGEEGEGRLEESECVALFEKYSEEIDTATNAWDHG